MSEWQIEDAGWKAIMADPQLRRARTKLSMHEIRPIVRHARASADTHPKGGDVKQAPLVSGAVPKGQTPKVQRHD